MSEQNPAKFTPEPPPAADATVRVSRSRGQEGVPSCTVCGHAPLVAGAPCPRCGGEASGVESHVVVDGRYRIESELGRGGMGVVHLARDTWLDRPVALKMIEPSWAAGSGDAVESFVREARALASIRNEYVVQIYAFGLHQGAQFFAMEYVRGSTLRQILAGHREHGDTIPVHRTLTILSRIAQGIDAVHAAGIIHRDVKPTNIVIEEHTGRPVLLDFGLAAHSEELSAAQAAGTPQYMAPEQSALSPEPITVRTDVYALGICAFEMLTGVLPFQSTDRAQLMRMHARKRPPPLSSIRRDLAPFDKIVARALAKDPAERYPSCATFAEVLAAIGDRWISSMLPTLPPPAPEVSAEAEWVARSLPAPAPPPSVPEAPRSQDTPATPRRVLVVDDSRVFRKFTVQAAQIAFYRCRKGHLAVEGASSGQEAIQRAAVDPPDLVLLDFDMPGLDGVGTLSRLRALPGGDRARVVVLSGRVSPRDRWRFEVLGVSDFVQKPIDFRQLVDRIEGIARRLEERDAASRA
jgi:eukaryotic-like serine/threonine-protein kinase